jgi:hypothetical protein
MIQLLKKLFGTTNIPKKEKNIEDLYPFKKSILTQEQKNRQDYILRYRPYGY